MISLEHKVTRHVRFVFGFTDQTLLCDFTGVLWVALRLLPCTVQSSM